MESRHIERDLEIYRKRQAGATHVSLSAEYGITPERARQISAKQARLERYKVWREKQNGHMATSE